MCRYAMYGPYKSHFACFECRKMFRHSYEVRDHYERKRGFSREEAMNLPVPCPECSRPMCNMGLDFKAPRQNEIEQWEKARQLYAHGYLWSSCGCNGPGLAVATLKDVQPFLQAKAQEQAARQRQEQSQAKWKAQRQRVRKARRQREREAAQGMALSAQRDS